jgi:pimeloyl-ACP methyl ester carboxylesterase
LRRFNKFGALAQLVEQWPFKPFVTGSNPVRPNLVLFFIILIFFLTNTTISFAAEKQVSILSKSNITLSGKLLTSEKNISVFLIVHGTRGHKGMEIIETLSSRLYEEGYDVLSINLSYGYSNREDDFLTCDIEHNHNEHESVNEIVAWYNYLIATGYEQINFIGHSRGGLNIMQALSIINNEEVNSYLLAPVIDTYKGTKTYYEKELGLPYDVIINSDENYNLADRYKKINFLFCENVDVYSKSFKSYLDFSRKKSAFPFTFDIFDLINNSKSPITIFSGTEDEILLDSYKTFQDLNQLNVRTVILEGGGHFFRDLYLEDVIDIILR